MSRRTPKYTKVSTKGALVKAIAALQNVATPTHPPSLDFETTSLHPEDGRVRLVSLAKGKVRYLVDFDGIRGGFNAVAYLFWGQPWVVFNAGFEMRWFLSADVIIACHDVGNLRRAIMGGGSFRLAQLLLWDLGVEMDKTEQVSNWAAKTLTKKQLDYAMDDAIRTDQLWNYWRKRADADHFKGFHMLNNMVPAVIEMEDTGMLLDCEAHKVLVADWAVTKSNKLSELRSLVPKEEVANVNSDTQWADYFAARMPDDWLKAWPRTEKSGQLQMTSKTLRALAAQAPGTPLATFFVTLADYKKIAKYLSSFGETLITKARLHPDGRIHARYNIGYAKTCRFSSSGPNLQQVPRDLSLLGTYTSIRRSFVARHKRLLVSLDYSGIELRVLALLSGDAQLLEDMEEGDVHAEVASFKAGYKIDKTTVEGKALRQAAKAVSFGIVYGIGAAGLAVSMGSAISQAQQYIDMWEERYPQAFGYRFKQQDEAQKEEGFVRMVDGGTIFMGKRAGLPKFANYGVQRGALAVMANAIRRHKATLDYQRITHGKFKSARMLATIHDAMIDETSKGDAQHVLALMQQDMESGFVDTFPGASTTRLVEGGVGASWGELA